MDCNTLFCIGHLANLCPCKILSGKELIAQEETEKNNPDIVYIGKPLNPKSFYMEIKL